MCPRQRISRNGEWMQQTQQREAIEDMGDDRA